MYYTNPQGTVHATSVQQNEAQLDKNIWIFYGTGCDSSMSCMAVVVPSMNQGLFSHYSDVIMSVMASQITSVSTVCSTVCSGADQRKHQSSVLLALCERNPPVTCGFPSQRASNMENVSIWSRHHVKQLQPSVGNRCRWPPKISGNKCLAHFAIYLGRISPLFSRLK